jgi:hypothetical protein
MIPRSSLVAAVAAIVLLSAAPAGARVRVARSLAGGKPVAGNVRAPKVHRGTSVHGDPFSAFRRPIGTVQPATRAHAAAAAGLATSWCGTPRTTDYTAASLGSLPQIKVIYAYPTGSPNRFSALANWMQGDIADIANRVAAASGGSKTLRFDVGSNCANPLAYVDIATLQLSHTAVALQAMDYVSRFAAIRADVLAHAAQLNATGGIRHFAVFADDTLPPGGGTSGVGQRPNQGGNVPDPGNPANGDGLVATIFGLGTDSSFIPPPQAPAAGGNRSDYLLHELMHTLGAVQTDAPHATAGGHCWDDHDVMCYNDGTAGSQLLRSVCAAAAELIDCNADDYFSPSPPAGSYLSTHWNAYNSTFLCPLVRCQTPGAPPTAALSVPSSPPTAPLTAWSGAPFDLSAAGSHDDTGFSSFGWDITGYDGRVDQYTTAPNISLTFRDSTPGVAGAVKLGVWATDLDGAISSAYVQVPIYPPDVFLGGTKLRQKLKTARRSGIAYTVYGGGGTVRITATVASSVKRRLHLHSRTLGRTRTLPAQTQLNGHLRLSSKIRRRLAHTHRSVRVLLTARLTPIGPGERAATDRASVTLR